MLSALWKTRRITIAVYLFSVLVNLFTMVILGLIYYNRVSKDLTHEFEKNNATLLAQTAKTMDFVISMSFDTVNKIYNDRMLAQTVNDLNQFTRSTVINSLDQIRDANQFVYSVVLYLEDRDEIYSTSYGFTGISTFPDDGWLDYYHADERQTVIIDWREISATIHGRLPLPKQKVFTIIRKLPFGAINRLGALMLNINADDLYQSAVSRLDIYNSGGFLVLDAEGGVVLGQDYAAELGFTSEIVQRLLTSEGGSIRYNTDKGERLAAISHSEILGLRYVWVKPYDEFRQALSQSMSTFLLYAVVTELLLIIVILVIIAITVKPVEEAVNILAADKKGGVRGVFQAAGESFQQAMSQNVQLRRQLSEAMPLLRERYLRELLEGTVPTPEPLSEALAKYGILFGHPYYVVVICEPLNLDELGGAGSGNFIMYACEKRLAEFLESRETGCCCVNMPERHLAVVLNLEGPVDGRVKQILVALLEDFAAITSEELSLDLVFSVSGHRHGKADLAALYASAVSGMRYRVVGHGAGEIVFADELPETQLPANPNFRFLQSLEAVIMRGDEEACCEMLDRHVASTFLLTRHTATYLQSFLMQAVMMLLSVGELLGIAPQESIFEELARIKTVKSGVKHIKKNLRLLCEETRARRQSMETGYFERIIAYINENYTADLSVGMISENCNISVSYLHKILKENTGETFTEIVTAKRVDEACRLLLEGHKVEDVARMVGYSSARYFITVFKKQKGSTPNKYRQIMEAESREEG